MKWMPALVSVCAVSATLAAAQTTTRKNTHVEKVLQQAREQLRQIRPKSATKFPEPKFMYPFAKVEQIRPFRVVPAPKGSKGKTYVLPPMYVFPQAKPRDKFDWARPYRPEPGKNYGRLIQSA